MTQAREENFTRRKMARQERMVEYLLSKFAVKMKRATWKSSCLPSKNINFSDMALHL